MKDYLIGDLFIKRRSLFVHVFKGGIEISFEISRDRRLPQAVAELFFIDIEVKERAELFEYLNAVRIAYGASSDCDDAVLCVFKSLDHSGLALAKCLFAVLFVVSAAVGGNQCICVDKGKPKMPGKGSSERRFARALKTDQDKAWALSSVFRHTSDLLHRQGLAQYILFH